MYQYEPLPPPASDDGGATASLVIGIIGLPLVGLLSPIALVLGIAAKRRIRDSGGSLGGEGRAVAGIALGAFGTYLLLQTGILLLVFVVGHGPPFAPFPR